MTTDVKKESIPDPDNENGLMITQTTQPWMWDIEVPTHPDSARRNVGLTATKPVLGYDKIINK